MDFIDRYMSNKDENIYKGKLNKLDSQTHKDQQNRFI